MATLTVFPQRFLVSMSVGGVVVVLVAAAVALLVLPPLLILMARRLGKTKPVATELEDVDFPAATTAITRSTPTGPRACARTGAHRGRDTNPMREPRAVRLSPIEYSG